MPLPKLGAKIDGFHLTGLLSEGRYTCVFKAHDEPGNRAVVVKFPKPNTATEAIIRQTFMLETWVATKVRSPFVGKTLEIPEDRRSGVYVVMPFYDGETLEIRLSRPPRIPFSTGLDLALKLGKAVAALHRAGVIHRDIKPDNIIVEQSRRNEGTGLKLIDLGVARLPNREDFLDLGALGTSGAPGTPSYMAPELFDGSPGDELSDQFALGVTIYRMFTGGYPYGEIEPFSRPRFRTAVPIQDELSDQFALGVTIYRMFTGGYPYGEIEPFSRPRFRTAVPLQARRSDLPTWLDRALGRAVSVNPMSGFTTCSSLFSNSNTAR